MPEAAQDANSLLLEICRCPNVHACLSHAQPHSCSEIVLSQAAASLAAYQVPEPWSGHLETAPILFISSNPSISKEEDYPHWSSGDAHLSDFFNNRFGGGRILWIEDGIRSRKQDGTYARSTKFWSEVRSRAKELLGRKASPGMDYALTEVVHCKSKKEAGVKNAVGQCSHRYLKRIVAASGARVLVVLGRTAEEAIRQEWSIPADTNVYGPATVSGRRRYVVFLPHPNKHGVRTLDKCLPNELQDLRQWLKSEKGPLS